MSLRDPMVYHQASNMCIMGALEGEEDEETEGMFEEVMTRDIFSVMKNVNLYIQEAQQTPSMINSN